jgi:hypothetical protein
VAQLPEDNKTRIRIRVARWVIFKPKIPFWGNFKGLRLENVDALYGHLEYFKAFGIFTQFGTFTVRWVHLFRFWNHAPRKIWQPWFESRHCLSF